MTLSLIACVSPPRPPLPLRPGQAENPTQSHSNVINVMGRAGS
jgi:hypothetical protein